MGKRSTKLSDRVDSLKNRRDRHYYGLSLRADLADLIHMGIERGGLLQRDLAKMTGKRESFISRLVNAGSNFKIGIAAQVLLPLGIEPVLMDRAEVEQLRRDATRRCAALAALDDQARVGQRLACTAHGWRGEQT